MKTLSTNATDNYLKQGVSIRTFVSIPDANLLLGTQAYTETTGSSGIYTDSLKSLGTISQSIEPYGGIAEVSGVTINNLEIGETFTLDSTTDVNTVGTASELFGAGRVARFGTGAEDYDLVRGDNSGSFSNSAVTVGRRYDGSNYTTYRGCMQFSIPSGITEITSASLDLTGLNKNATSSNDFEVVLVEGSWSSWESGGIYNDFSSWTSAASSYTATELQETWRTEQFSTANTNYVRFNSSGRAAILAKSGETAYFKLIVMSDNDYTYAAAPTTDEYVRFGSSNVAINLRYNTVDLFNQEATIYLAMSSTGNTVTPTATSNMEKVWAGVVDDWNIDQNSLSLKLRQNDLKIDTFAPTDIFEIENFPNIDDDYIGEVKPFFYGNFFDLNTPEYADGVGYYTDTRSATTAVAGTTTGIFDVIASRDFIKCPITNPSGEPQIHISSLSIKSFERPIFSFNDSQKAFNIYPVFPRETTDANSTYKTLRLDTTPDNLAYSRTRGAFRLRSTTDGNYKYASVYAVKPTRVATASGTLTNQNNAFNKNTSKTMGMSTGAIAYFYFNQPNATSIRADRVDFFYSVSASLVDVDVQFKKSNGTWESTTDTGGTTGNAQITVEMSDTSNVDTLDGLRLKLTNGSDANTVNKVFAFTGYETNAYKELYGYGKGVVFGSWIDASGRSTTYTQNDLIQTPPYVIESLCREFLGLGSSQINTTSIDESSSKVSNWNIAFQQNERKKTNDILNDIGIETKTKVFYDNNDKLKTIAFDKNKNFPNQSDSDIGDIPSNLDIFSENATLSSGQFAQHPILSSKFSGGAITDFSIDHIGLDKTYNDFKVNYRERYSDGEYRESIYMDNISSVSINNTSAGTSFNFINNGASINNFAGGSSFVFSTTAGVPNVFTDVSPGFLARGFASTGNENIQITGSPTNDNVYTTVTATSSVMNFVLSQTVASESASAGVEIFKIHRDAIESSSVDLSVFSAGDTIEISGSCSNDDTFTVFSAGTTKIEIVESNTLTTEGSSSGAGVIINARHTNFSSTALDDSQTESVLKTLCTSSFANIGSKQTLERDLSYIRDKSTASKIMQFYIERMTTNRMICVFTTSITGIAHEVGDFINIRHSVLENLIGSAEMNVKKWEIIGLDFNLDTYNIKIEAIEV